MIKPLILFFVSKPNVYSFAKLLSTIENNSDILGKYEIVVLRSSLYQLDLTTLYQYQIPKRPFVIIPISLMTAQKADFQLFMNYKAPMLKKINPNIYLVVGGWHATGDPEEILALGADYAIIGEAEISFPQFLIEVLNNPSTIPKIYSLPNAVNLNLYPPFSQKYRVFCPIEISRGCPFRCKFCQTGQQFPTMKHASIESIVSWIQKAVDIRYDRVWFTTPNAFAYGTPRGGGTNPSLVEKLLKSIRDIKNLDEIYFGSFPSEVRPEFVTKNMMDAVHPYISNKYFTIGAQSASDELLRSIWRGHTFQQVLDATDMILDYGYGADLDFIFGLPGETESNLDETLNYFEDVLKSTKNIRIHTHTFMPLPGTPFSNEPIGVIRPRVEKLLGRLASRNKSYGSHEKQSQIQP
jgi:B12-binding domain/radical SAM domain protein